MKYVESLRADEPDPVKSLWWGVGVTGVREEKKAAKGRGAGQEGGAWNNDNNMTNFFLGSSDVYTAAAHVAHR